jgi:hypothetical protein
MRFFSKVASSAIAPALNIGASLIGAKGQAKSEAEQRKFEAEQAALGRGEQAREFDVTSGLTREQFQNQITQQDAQRKAYESMLGRAGTMADTGEQSFLTEANTADPTIEAQRQDLLTGQNKALQAGTGEMRANLAIQGVRGGQVATQMRRGIGEMTEAGISDVNKLATEDSLRRAAERRAYMSAKAGAGRAGQLSYA